MRPRHRPRTGSRAEIGGCGARGKGLQRCWSGTGQGVLGLGPHDAL